MKTTVISLLNNMFSLMSKMRKCDCCIDMEDALCDNHKVEFNRLSKSSKSLLKDYLNLN